MLLPLPAAVVNFGRGAWSYRRRTTPAERAAGKRCRKEGPCYFLNLVCGAAARLSLGRS
jgi:hypothetical protein